MNELLDQQDALKCCQNKIVPTKEHAGDFSDIIHKCVYKCLERQVLVNKTGPLIGFIVECATGHVLDNIPSTTTVCHAVREMGFLSDIQAKETFLGEVWDEHFGLGWYLN